MTCEENSRSDRLLALREGLLDATEARQLRAHVDQCAACATSERACLEETDALVTATRRWIRALPEVAVPDVPATGGPRRRVPALTAAALLLAAGAALLVLASRREDGRGAAASDPLRIQISATRALGLIPPPSVAQLVLLADRVVEGKVVAIDEQGVLARECVVVRGPDEGIPDRVRLVVPAGHSELGSTPVRAAPGDPLLLLFVRRKTDGLVLVTGDAHSVVTAKGLVYLETANVHRHGYEARRRWVLEAFGLAQLLRETAWDRQSTLLEAALGGRNPIGREVAICWYDHQRSGFASRDLSMLEENRHTRPPLENVEHALLALVPSRKGELSTLSGRAVDLLALRGAYHWVARLDSAESRESVFLLLAAFPEDPTLAVRRASGDRGPLVTYLRRALLARHGDRAALHAVLATELPGATAAEVQGFGQVPAWPPYRMIGWIAGRAFEGTAEARAWIRAAR